MKYFALPVMHRGYETIEGKVMSKRAERTGKCVIFGVRESEMGNKYFRVTDDFVHHPLRFRSRDYNRARKWVEDRNIFTNYGNGIVMDEDDTKDLLFD
jgi:hypothetical protein